MTVEELVEARPTLLDPTAAVPTGTPEVAPVPMPAMAVGDPVPNPDA